MDYLANGLYINYFQYEISCPSRAPPCNHASSIANQLLLLSLLLLLHVGSLLFCRSLTLPPITHTPPPVQLARGSVISLAGFFYLSEKV